MSLLIYLKLHGPASEPVSFEPNADVDVFRRFVDEQEVVVRWWLVMVDGVERHRSDVPILAAREREPGVMPPDADFRDPFDRSGLYEPRARYIRHIRIQGEQASPLGRLDK